MHGGRVIQELFLDGVQSHGLAGDLAWPPRPSYGEVLVICWWPGRAPQPPGLSLTPEVPHGHHVPSAVLVPVTPVFSTAERLALAGFLAGHSGLTRQAYELDLRPYVSTWCQTRHLALFGARRGHRVLRPRPGSPRRARATITRRLCTIAGFYRLPLTAPCRIFAISSHSICAWARIQIT
jgi:hypothetical protein